MNERFPGQILFFDFLAFPFSVVFYGKTLEGGLTTAVAFRSPTRRVGEGDHQRGEVSIQYRRRSERAAR